MHWEVRTKEWKLQISFLVFSSFEPGIWSCAVCTRSQQQHIEPRKSNIQSQAIQFIPVRDIQNLQRQSSATFTHFSLLRKSRRSFVFAKVHVLILQPLHSCMASQLLRSCRHRRRICVSLTAQGFSWSIRSRRSPTNCQGIHSVMHLGTGYLWPKYHPGRLLITQKLEKMEHIWSQQTLPHDAYMLTDWAISHLKLPELQSLFLTVIQRIYSGDAS